MKDERNHLFWNYKDILDSVKPDGFIFENVTGLLNMEGGETFRQIVELLSETCECVTHWVLRADEHAVPQRRARVFIIGQQEGPLPEAPNRITSVHYEADLFGGVAPAISVEEALDDLPPLQHGADGSASPYRHDPRTAYQSFMRGDISPDEYLQRIVNGKRLQLHC